MDKTPKRLLTKRDVAEALDVSLRSVDTLIAEGKLRVVRPGGLNVVRVEPEELTRVIEQSRAGAA